MNDLATHLSGFLREHLPAERNASQHTCETYAYSFQLLVEFAAGRMKCKPSQLTLGQIDASMIMAFLEHIETKRGNCARTRNARLAAIKSFFRYLEYRLPAYLDQSRQIHAIPMKKTDQMLIDYLTRGTEGFARLTRPAFAIWHPRPGNVASGLCLWAAVAELVSLRLDQFDPRTPATIHIVGKGRRERVLPLWKETVTVLKDWLNVRCQTGDSELFLNANGRAMTRSGFEYILAKHVSHAAKQQPLLAEKRVSPHVLRHTCAMHTLQATGDVRKVSLWLGHASMQSTEMYLRADPTEKLEALASRAPPGLQRGRFRAPDKLMAMLQAVSR
jgi:Site-specific recombinase XerD